MSIKSLLPNPVAIESKVTHPLNPLPTPPPAVETEEPTHPLNPMPTPAPTHPLNPMPTPAPTHPLNPITNPPASGGDTPKKISFRQGSITEFKQTRGSIELSGVLNKSVSYNVRWVFPSGFSVSTRHFLGSETAARAMTKIELKAVKTMLKAEIAEGRGNIDGYNRLISTIDQALKIKIKHPSQL